MNKFGYQEKIYDLTEADLPDPNVSGESIDIDEILGVNLIIKGMDTRPSKFSDGDYAIIPIEVDGEQRVVMSGSKVLMRQIKEEEKKIPFRCVIMKQKSSASDYEYYTLAPANIKKTIVDNKVRLSKQN